MSWIEKEITIGEVKGLLEEGKELEVLSPDGYVPVNFFVDKGEFQEHLLTTESGKSVRCNEDHLFETVDGWKFAKDIINEQHEFLTESGTEKGTVTLTDNTIPIVDINVDHPNHRYYTNGVSSHNTGTGKSLFMCHVAASTLMQGKNVLYITMEMAEERIAERIDANLFNVTIDDLHKLPKKMFDNKVQKIKDKTQGKLIIKEYPTAGAHTGHFRALIKELQLKKEFTPDIIFIDYLNICASSRVRGMGGSINSYSYIKSIAEEIRGLSVEFNLPIVSATQTTRTGYSNTDIGLEDTSESFGLPATCDFMFALISNDDLAEMNQIAVKQLKNRYGDINDTKKFIVGIDRSKMKLYDVEQSAQSGVTQTTTNNTTNGNIEFGSFGKQDKFAKLNF